MAPGETHKKKRETTGARAGSRTGSHDRTTGSHDRQTFIDGQAQASGHTGSHPGSDSITADGTGHVPWEEEPGDGFEQSEQDEDGEDMTGEREYPIPEGWDLDDQTNEEFWTKVFQIEAAQEEGLEQGRAAVRAAGFLSEGHFEWVRERYTERHGGDTNFPQSMMNARQAHQHAQLRQAVGAELLEPIEGVTIEIYATVQVRRRVLPPTPGAFGRLLEDYDLTEKAWARIDGLWQARLNDPANASAANPVTEAYRKHHAEASKRFKPGPR